MSKARYSWAWRTWQSKAKAMQSVPPKPPWPLGQLHPLAVPWLTCSAFSSTSYHTFSKGTIRPCPSSAQNHLVIVLMQWAGHLHLIFSRSSRYVFTCPKHTPPSVIMSFIHTLPVALGPQKETHSIPYFTGSLLSCDRGLPRLPLPGSLPTLVLWLIFS